ncbi:MAG: iron ABC transporter permease [Candidatus Sumerlaeaceae bacterium]|nr:iron ABC transporter permease [Candidatus Sumerlaeaceae bacterium]
MTALPAKLPRGSGAPLGLSRLTVLVSVGFALCLLVLLVVPLLGGGVDLRLALAAPPFGPYDSPDALVFWGTRVPRVLLGLLVGGSLAVSGLAFQAVLRNPLADPYVLGVSSGAALGKALAMLWPVSGSLAIVLWTPMWCFVGALVPLLLLYGFAASGRRFSAMSLLLAGVMVNVSLSAVILLIQYFADFTKVRQMQLWWMGALDVIGYGRLAGTAPLAVLAVMVIWLHARAMNLLSLDSCTAAHLGVDVRRTVNLLVWAASVLTATVVAVSGPIGFVGLIVPHALRLMFNADNRLLVPLSMTYGGAFLVLCDTVGWRGLQFARWLGAPVAFSAEIPVGVVTALVGGPLFLFLLFRTMRAQAAACD